jgi:hypothetical protein
MIPSIPRNTQTAMSSSTTQLSPLEFPRFTAPPLSSSMSQPTAASLVPWNPPGSQIDGTVNDRRMEAAVRHRENQPQAHGANTSHYGVTVPPFATLPTVAPASRTSQSNIRNNGRMAKRTGLSNTRQDFRYKICIHPEPVSN